jgi:hypothetical protein
MAYVNGSFDGEVDMDVVNVEDASNHLENAHVHASGVLSQGEVELVEEVAYMPMETPKKAVKRRKTKALGWRSRMMKAIEVAKRANTVALG